MNPCAAIKWFSSWVDGWCSLHPSLSSTTTFPFPTSSLAWLNAVLFSFTAIIPRFLDSRFLGRHISAEDHAGVQNHGRVVCDDAAGRNSS
jgi:hypothetical protein